MSYMRSPYYAYVCAYEDDGGKDIEWLNVMSPADLEKGEGEHLSMPLDVFDELALMRVAEIMVDKEAALGEIADRAIEKHHGNFGCAALGQLRGVPQAIEDQLQEKLKAIRST